MTREEIIVKEEHQNTRIDKLLSDAYDFSRSRVQSLIKDGHILVQQNPVKANYKVKVDDVITVVIPDDEVLEVEAENIPIEIVYEDSDLMVINKPRGMVVHPAVGNLKGTLVNAVLFHCKDLSGINGVLRPGIVHRIDKDTSGLLLIAKNDKAHLSLSEQLKDKSVSRKYKALVHGVLEHDYGTIDAPIGRDVKDRKRMAITEHNSKDAITHFKVLERFHDYTLVECSLETGRTHQIRVHMQYIKHPIVGDPTYGYRKTMDVGGQLLHAYEITFVHPSTNERMTFQCELPQVFLDVLHNLETEEL